MYGPKESKPDPRLPTTETLAKTQVTLGTTSEGFVAADQGNQQKIRLTDDFAGRKFSIQALNAICKALAAPFWSPIKVRSARTAE
jgi:hypothetical protein